MRFVIFASASTSFKNMTFVGDDGQAGGAEPALAAGLDLGKGADHRQLYAGLERLCGSREIRLGEFADPSTGRRNLFRLGPFRNLALRAGPP